MTDLQRFWSYVSKEKGQGPKGACWEWQAARHKAQNGLAGYGQFIVRGKHFLAHRSLSVKLKHAVRTLRKRTRLIELKPLPVQPSGVESENKHLTDGPSGRKGRNAASN